MAVDPTISLQAKVPDAAAPPNLLLQMSQLGAVQKSRIENQLLGQTLQQRNALGQAYATAGRDPTTGAPIMSDVIRNLQAQGPVGAMLIPQAVQAMQAQAKVGYELNTAALNQTQQRLSAFNSAMAPLLRLGNGIQMGDVTRAVSGLAAAGVPVDDLMRRMAANPPSATSGPGLMSWVMNQVGSTLPPELSSRLYTPNLTQVNQGGTVSLVDTNPWTNPSAIGSSLPMTMTPSEQLGQAPGPAGPQGQTTTLTGAQRAQNAGLGNLLPPGSRPPMSGSGVGGLVPNGGRFAPQPSPGTPSAGPMAGGGGTSPSLGMAGPGAPMPAPGGAMPPGPGMPMAPPAVRLPPGMAPQGGMAPPPGIASPQPAAPSWPPPGAVVTGLGPGQTAAIEGAGKEGQNQANALSASAATIPQQQAQISAMLGDLTKYGSGPNSEFYGNARARMVQMGVAPGSWAEGQAAQENFTKMANQFLAQQAASLGAVTNDKLALAGESGPNPLFTSLGNQGVLHIAAGTLNAVNARNQAWQTAQRTQGLTGADFQNWSSQFNNSGFDPRTFWYEQMSPAERSTLVAGMTAPQRDEFVSNLKTAVGNGWVNPQALGTSAAPAAPTSTPDAGTPVAASPPAGGGVPLAAIAGGT